MKSKVEGYLGLCLKAGKLRTGVNVAKTIKTRVPLMIMCNSASDNTIKEIIKLSEKLSSKIVVSKKTTLEEIFNKKNCKLALVCDNSFANAILNNLDDEFVLFGGK